MREQRQSWERRCLRGLLFLLLAVAGLRWALGLLAEVWWQLGLLILLGAVFWAWRQWRLRRW